MRVTYPDMSEEWTQRINAISPKRLCNDSEKCHEDTNEAVLEYPKPDDLGLVSTVAPNT